MRTVTGRRSVRGGLLSTAVAGSLLLGTAGCGGDGEKSGLPKDYKVVAGTELCGGEAVSAEASRALKVITGVSRFEASGREYSVAKASADVVEAFPVPGVPEDVCRIYSPLDTPEFELRVTWDLEKGAPTGPSAPEFTELKMGELAVAGADKAYVFFACKSGRFSDPSREIHISLGVRRGGMPKPPDEDRVEALKDAYATVAHSFSLAMAKELRCEKNGGLPAKPVLNPA